MPCCVFCGNSIRGSHVARSSRAQVQNAIFLSALKLHASVGQELLDTYFPILNESQKYICAEHFVNTAQNLLTDVVRSGGRVSRTTDNVYYMNEGDIPDDIVSFLDNETRSFASHITVRRADVCRYLNLHMKKYYGTTGWCLPSETLQANQEEAENLQDVSAQAIPPDPVEPMDYRASTPPPVRHGDSGSTNKTMTGSSYSPNKSLPLDEEMEVLDETESPLLERYYLVKGRKLLELLKIGCNCDSKEGMARLTAEGSNPIITYITKDAKKERWDGQDKIPRTKRYEGNLMSGIAAITTGLRVNRLQQWGRELGLSIPSKSTFYDMFKRLRPCIQAVYDRHHDDVMQTIKAAYQGEGRSEAWDIAIDGAFDSRGHSAEICRVLAVDLRTKLCIHTVVLNRRETAGISGAMEKEGFRRMLDWLRSRNISINSISTDRSAMYGSEIRQYNAEFHADIKWQLDPWHLGRYLYKNLRAAAQRRGCEDLRLWIKELKAHLYDAVRVGAAASNGELVKQYFNTCLYHIAGVHEWNKDAKTGDITRCAHEMPLVNGTKTIAMGSTAHDALKKIVLQGCFQKDLGIASPLGGTSHCEQKNSLDRLYCSKDIHLPISTYPFYVMLSTLHANALRLAEMKGERVVKRRCRVVRKYNDHASYVTEKTPVAHVWRREIFIEFLNRIAEPSEDEDEDEEEDGEDDEEDDEEEDEEVDEEVDGEYDEEEYDEEDED